jgi:hypothetical protein
MALLTRKYLFRRLAVMLACLLALQGAIGVARATLQLAERTELASLGLLGAVICHGDPISKSPAGEQKPNQPAGQKSGHCDCCLTGCGAAGLAGIPNDQGALSRPLLAADTATRVAIDAAHLRSFVDERTRNPRSPPAIS